MATPLLNKLLDCAKAIEERNLNHADSLLKDIVLLSDAEANSATKKAGRYFAEALVRRLYQLYGRNPRPLVRFRHDNDIIGCKFDRFLWFANYTVLPSFYESLRGKKEVHVIDFSFMVDIWQYNNLMKLLANEAGGPLSFRITFVGPKLSDHLGYLKLLRLQLTTAAEKLHIDFEWTELLANNVTEIVGSVSQLSRKDKDEAVAVKWEFELHKLLGVPSEIFNWVMSTLKDLKPEIMVIVEQEADHNSPDLLERLSASFKHYSVILESIKEDDFGKLSDYGVLWERYFRRQISKVVAQESIGQAERHETWVQWRDRLFRAGFHPARLLFREGRLFHDRTDYEIEEKNRRPLLCRHGHPLAITSAWKPDLTHDESSGMEIGDPESRLSSSNIARDARWESGLASNSGSHEEATDDAPIMLKGNTWSFKCLSINRIAASAKIFDLLEYACHMHDLPVALTWTSDRREENKSLSGKFTLQIEETACFVNDVGMKGFVEACLKRPVLEEGQGIAGKALQSNVLYVPDVSKLHAMDYPFLHDAWEFGLHAVVAVKLSSSYLSSTAYILEFFLPLEMTETSEQQKLTSEILSTLRDNCRNSWRVGVEDNISSEVRIQEDETCNTSTAVIPNTAPRELPDVGSLNSSQCKALRIIFEPTGDEAETCDQEAEEQDTVTGPAAPRPEIEEMHIDISRLNVGTSNKRPRSEVWQYFDKVIENGQVWAKCRVCSTKYRGESTRGTTNLHKHLRSCLGKK